MGILSDKRVVQYVLQVLTGSTDYDVDESEEYDYHSYYNNRLWNQLVIHIYCRRSNNRLLTL